MTLPPDYLRLRRLLKPSNSEISIHPSEGDIAENSCCNFCKPLFLKAAIEEKSPHSLYAQSNKKTVR